MINFSPYAMLIVAFIFHKDKTNIVVLGLFALFYTASMVAHNSIENDPVIFQINLVLTSIFVVMIAQLTKVTAMMLIFCVTDILLTIIDVMSFLSYHYKLDLIYQLRWKFEQTIIYFQWSALWVTDARHVNLVGYYATIKHNIYNFARMLAYR